MYRATTDSPKRMRIGELAEAAGVSRETIHFYLREGLLPRPEKVNARVAYFDSGHLVRLRLIKAFQQAHLPLAKIREQLEGISRIAPLESPGVSEHALKVVTEFLSLDGEESALSQAEVAERAGLTRDQVEKLEELGVLQPQMIDGQPFYTQADAEAATAARTIVDQGVALDALRFVRRYSRLVEQESAFILHHLHLPAVAAGRRNQVSATLAGRALRVIETYLRRQYRRRHGPFGGSDSKNWPDPLAEDDGRFPISQPDGALKPAVGSGEELRDASNTEQLD